VNCPTPQKKAWRDKKTAKRVLSRMQHREPAHVYRCECGAFHIGRVYK